MNIREIRSLAGLKMEKNFTAVIDKGYSRMPHIEYPIFSKDELNLAFFVTREKRELDGALSRLTTWRYWRKLEDGKMEWRGPTREELSEMSADDRTMLVSRLKDAMLEIGDVSNTLDYLFEALLRIYTEART